MSSKGTKKHDIRSSRLEHISGKQNLYIRKHIIKDLFDRTKLNGISYGTTKDIADILLREQVYITFTADR